MTSAEGIRFMLFERVPDGTERTIGDRIRIGSVLIAEDGSWQFTPAGDGPSTYGGPQVQKDKGIWWYTPRG